MCGEAGGGGVRQMLGRMLSGGEGMSSYLVLLVPMAICAP